MGIMHKNGSEDSPMHQTISEETLHGLPEQHSMKRKRKIKKQSFDTIEMNEFPTPDSTENDGEERVKKSKNRKKKTIESSRKTGESSKKRKHLSTENNEVTPAKKKCYPIDSNNEEVSASMAEKTERVIADSTPYNYLTNGIINEDSSSSDNDTIDNENDSISDASSIDTDLENSAKSINKMLENCALCSIKPAVLLAVPCEHMLCETCARHAFWYPSQKYHQGCNRTDTCPLCATTVIELAKYGDSNSNKIFRQTMFNLYEICKFSDDCNTVHLRPSKRATSLLPKVKNNEQTHSVDEFLDDSFTCPEFWTMAEFEDARKFVRKTVAKHKLNKRIKKEMDQIFGPETYVDDSVLLYPRSVEKFKLKYSALSDNAKRVICLHPKRVLQSYRKNINPKSFNILYTALQELHCRDASVDPCCVICEETENCIEIPCCKNKLCVECIACFAKVSHYAHRKAKGVPMDFQLCPLCLDVCIKQTSNCDRVFETAFERVFAKSYIQADV